MTESTDVTIVGMGPTGATLANLLCGLDVSVCVIEADEAPYSLPRATHFDGEAMRVFQTIGLADKVLPHTHVNPGMTFVNAQHEVILDWPRPKEVGPQNWHPSYRFHQPALEIVLRDGLKRYPNARVLSGFEVTAVEQSEARSLARYTNKKTGEEGTVNSKFIVGCDGGRSPVRNMCGVQLEDLGSNERWIVIDLIMHREVDGLTDGTVQYCNPIRPTTFMRCQGNRRRWEFMVMPGDDVENFTKPEGVWKLLAPWLTPRDAEIERAVMYFFHSAIAHPWRIGRVLLAGDAAHQMPPFLGQGLCAGVRDSSNLAWKLARVVKGKSPISLLDTYETERSSHVRQTIEHAIEVGRVIQVTDAESARQLGLKLASGPKVMKSINPRLGDGLHGTMALPAGVISSQPILSGGRPLDDVAGQKFVILGASEILNGVSDVSRERWRTAEAVILPDEGLDYLAELGTKAVVIRPDRYVLGVADNAGQLDRLSELLPVIGE